MADEWGHLSAPVLSIDIQVLEVGSEDGGVIIASITDSEEVGLGFSNRIGRLMADNSLGMSSRTEVLHLDSSNSTQIDSTRQTTVNGC